MTEYHTIKRIDNSRLVRPMAPARLQDFWRRVAAGGAMAACLLFYAWQHFACIQLQYEGPESLHERIMREIPVWREIVEQIRGKKS